MEGHHSNGSYLPPTVSNGNFQSTPSSTTSLQSLSPPASPYDAGPPPTYEQHLNMVNRKRMLPTDNTAMNLEEYSQVVVVAFPLRASVTM